MNEIYLDYAATTPLDPRVRARLVQALDEEWGNPSSVHAVGRKARRAVEEAREAVAQSIGAHPREIIFTSGATEAVNLALRGMLLPDGKPALLTSPTEHSAVTSTVAHLEKGGRTVRRFGVERSGELSRPVDQVDDEVGMVALMLVNNETGVRNDVESVAARAKESGALVFCDAVQAWGTGSVDVKELGVDAMAISAHKAYGPKGIGALYLRDGLQLDPVIFGGTQERGLRPGTHNGGGIVAMGEVARLVMERCEELAREIAAARDAFEEQLAGLEDIHINGSTTRRGPKQSNVTVSGVDGEALLMGLDAMGVRARSGSACSAGSIEPSHVLRAMGLRPEEAKASIRFSFGAGVTVEAAREAASRFGSVIESCRALANF